MGQNWEEVEFEARSILYKIRVARGLDSSTVRRVLRDKPSHEAIKEQMEKWKMITHNIFITETHTREGYSYVFYNNSYEEFSYRDHITKDIHEMLRKSFS